MTAPTIPGYDYIRELGVGGYSVVYLYRQRMPEQPVAIKVLKDSGLDDAARARFTAEANTMAKLSSHPYIVSVLAADITADGQPYLVMPYLPNEDFARRSAVEPLSVTEVLRTGVHVASAIETAHRAGILHRDVKPANILTSEFGTPALSDFGIAAHVSEVDTDEANDGVSIPWSAPEVLLSGAASVQSDVYSLAATLWTLLVGRPPFAVADRDISMLELVTRIRDVPPRATGRGDVPASLERLLAQSMAKNPAHRPSSAIEFARALQQIEQDLHLSRTEVSIAIDRPVASETRATGAATVVRGPQRVRDVQEPIADAPVFRSDRAPQMPGRPPSQGGRPTLPSTVQKPKVVAEDTPHPAPVSRGVRRPVLIVVAAAVVAVGIALGVVLSSGGSSPAASRLPASATAGGGNQQAGQFGAPGVPGTVTVTGARLNSDTVRFTWTYDNSESTDTFRWRTAPAGPVRSVSVPQVDLPGRAGTRVCVQVEVVRADGSDAATGYSAPGCVT